MTTNANPVPLCEDVTENEAGGVIEFPVTVELTEEDERNQLMSELSALATYCNYTVRTVEHARSLSIEDLREYVRIQRKQAGGSLTVAALIDATEEEYAEHMHAALTRRKVSILEAKGLDFMRIARRLSEALGSDVTVKGMKFNDYHSLLGELVTHTSVVDLAVANLAAILGIEIPNDQFLPNGGGTTPVIPGQAMTTKGTLYVLQAIASNLQYYISHAGELEKHYNHAQAEHEKSLLALRSAKEHEARVMCATEDVIDRVNQAMSRTAAFVVMRVSSTNDEYIGKKDFDEKLSKNNLCVCSLPDALFFNSRATAADFVTRLDGRMGELEVIRLVQAAV